MNSIKKPETMIRDYRPQTGVWAKELPTGWTCQGVDLANMPAGAGSPTRLISASPDEVQQLKAVGVVMCPVEEVDPASLTTDDYLEFDHEELVRERWDSADEVRALRLELLLSPHGGPVGYFAEWATRLHDKRERLVAFVAECPELAHVSVPPLPEAASAILNRPHLQLDFADISIVQWMREHTHEEDARAVVDLQHEIARLRTALAAKAGDYDDVEDAFHAYDVELEKLRSLCWTTLERAQTEAQNVIERAK